MIKFKEKSDIGKFLSTLDPTKFTVLKHEGNFFCAIKWEKGEWNFWFDDFTEYSYSEDSEYYLLRLLEDLPLTSLTFTTQSQLCFEIRQGILRGCIKMLTTPRIKIGENEREPILPSLISAVNNSIGKVVVFKGGGHKGILVGLSSSLEDYYYVTIGEEGKFIFESCVGGFDDTSDSPWLSVEECAEKVSSHFSNPLCTEICLISI